ncbi:MAG TPA: hypothetical protein VFW87_04480 [Pirellulales bacterium]|nr:hypothetical protein [Pirellulales bacterium]
MPSMIPIGPFFLLAYIAFAIAIARSAFQSRGKHWPLGVLLSVLLLTLPLWVGAMFWVWTFFFGTAPNPAPGG